MSGAVGALNVAATRVGTRALGPGRRSVVWVQGCPFRCAGCLAPEWIPERPAREVQPAVLAAELLADPAVEGLTLSGGEPMAQAAGLAALVRAARAVRDVSVICFTGYRLERLRRRPPGPDTGTGPPGPGPGPGTGPPGPGPGVAELLDCVDVLIDGQYVAALDDGRGLRGSANQRVHHLTPRLADCGYDFEGRARTAEIAVDGTSALLVGVPPPGLLADFDAAVTAVRDRYTDTTPDPHPHPHHRSPATDPSRGHLT